MFDGGMCRKFRGTAHRDIRRLRLRSHGLAHVREGMRVPSTWFARASRCGVASALAPVIAFCFGHATITRGYGWGHGCPPRCSPSPAHHRRIVAHHRAIGMPLARGTRQEWPGPTRWSAQYRSASDQRAIWLYSTTCASGAQHAYAAVAEVPVKACSGCCQTP